MAHMVDHNRILVDNVKQSLVSSVIAEISEVVSLISSFLKDQSPFISRFPKVSAEFFNSSS